MSLAGIAAVKRVVFTKAVARSEPFQRTTDPETRFEPATVKVNPGPVAGALEGESEVMNGAGLLVVKVTALELPPPGEGLNTVTWDVPAAEMSVEVMVAVN